MSLMPVDEALRRLLKGAGPSRVERVPIAQVAFRVLAEPLAARRTQPPFDGSAMDGYAVRAADIAAAPATLAVVGTAAAGSGYRGTVEPGQAVRIFTGAPVPRGADTISIQENVRKLSDISIEVLQAEPVGRHIRAAGLDFSVGDRLLEAGRVLDPAALSLAAAANHGHVPVWKKPLVAIISTGDELLPPGSDLGPDQIIASNSYGVAALAWQAGAEVLDLGIASDRPDAIATKVRQALDAKADVIVTSGGASVGDHDLVQGVLTGLGMSLDFWKIAMRPGKPLMFGSLGATRCLGLPGNPVASLVCSILFLKPLLARLGGRCETPLTVEARLGSDVAGNDLRQDYVRGRVEMIGGETIATPFPVQDSSMLRVLAEAGGLIVRPPFAPPAAKGDACRVVLLR